MLNNQKISKEWNTKKLKNCLSLLKDGTHGTHIDTSNGIMLLSAKDIINGKITLSVNDARKISLSDFNLLHKNYHIRDNDIVLTIVGTIGRCAIVKNYENNYTFQRSVAILRPNKEITSEYLFCYIQSNYFQKELLKKQSISAQPGVYLDDLSKIPLLLPPLAEQKKIAEILSCWDDGIEKLTKLIELKKQQKKGLMQRFIYYRNDIMHYKVSDLFELGRGRIISKDEIEINKGQYPVYSSQTSNDGILGSINTYDFYGEYITWTTDGANAGAVFYRNGKFNCTNVCGIAKAKKSNVNLYYAKCFLNHITKKYVSYVGNPKLMNNIFAIIPLNLPNIKVQNKIAQILQTADNEINLLNKKLEALKLQKKGLMQQLLTGKIRVKINK